MQSKRLPRVTVAVFLGGGGKPLWKETNEKQSLHEEGNFAI